MPSDYPFPAFYFNVKIGGSEDKFMEVNGFGRSMKTEDYIELGENRYVTKLPSGVGNQGNLVLKRGLISPSSTLLTWCKTVLDDFKTPIETRLITVDLLGEDAKPVFTWSFADAYPVKWSVEKFSAMENKVAVETVEFAYTTFTRNVS